MPVPSMIVYEAFLTSSSLWAEDRMKAMFRGFFGTFMTYCLLNLIWVGDITLSLSVEASIAMPTLFIGFAIAIWMYEKILKNIFRWIVIIGLTINTIILLLTS